MHMTPTHARASVVALGLAVMMAAAHGLEAQPRQPAAQPVDANPDRPDLPHYGAGEAVCKPTLAAVANAVFDATGVRLRRVPFRADRVLAALAHG
jgi:hypothetical protein